MPAEHIESIVAHNLHLNNEDAIAHLHEAVTVGRDPSLPFPRILKSDIVATVPLTYPVYPYRSQIYHTELEGRRGGRQH